MNKSSSCSSSSNSSSSSSMSISSSGGGACVVRLIHKRIMFRGGRERRQQQQQQHNRDRVYVNARPSVSHDFSPILRRYKFNNVLVYIRRVRACVRAREYKKRYYVVFFPPLFRYNSFIVIVKVETRKGCAADATTIFDETDRIRTICSIRWRLLQQVAVSVLLFLQRYATTAPNCR